MTPAEPDSRYERILREYLPALRRLVAAYESDQHEREDLLQDIAFAIWRALPSFRGASSTRTFVYRIAHNRAISHRLTGSRRSRVIALGETAPDIPDARPDAASEMDRAELGATLMMCVRSLSPVLRQTLILSLEGLSNPEIAEVLGVSPGTVAVRLTRARSAVAISVQQVPT